VTVDAPEIVIALRSRAWREAFADARGCCCRAAAAAVAVAAPEAANAEISIVLADDAFIRGLNRDWRGRDAATNVLAFPGGDTTGSPDGAGAPVLLGDVVIALETLLAEAGRDGISPEAHLAHLVVHGVLHLLGFDHEDDAEAETMEAAEALALARLGIENPYAGDHSSQSEA
jgi:probable rRNA maturation factor